MEGPGKPRQASKQNKSGPVINLWFHPAAYETAMILANDNRKRVHVAPDGSGAVIVTNTDRRPDWLKQWQRQQQS
jgi:hypothetical protein